MKSASESSKFVTSMFCWRTRASSRRYSRDVGAALRKSVMMGMKNCGRTTYIFS